MVWCVAFEPRPGGRLVSGSFDRTARAWSLEPGELLGLAERLVARDLSASERARYATYLGER